MQIVKYRGVKSLGFMSQHVYKVWLGFLPSLLPV